MRLLHTSDWHLGVTTDGIARDADHARFLEWLAETIAAEQVDVLVVAGDVFDNGQPSAEAQRLYYGLLARLPSTGIRRVVVVGGNHDSAARLEAPREVLSALAVDVIGGAPAGSPDEVEPWARALCPIQGPSGEIELVVLAVPYIHEFRLGVKTALVDTDVVRAQFRQRLRDLYHRLTDMAAARWPGASLVATGHLTCLGAESGDAPAEIHLVGTLGALPPDVFDDRLAHVALGHLHRSFRVGASRAFYSGSPVALSIKESKSERRVLLVETAGDAGPALVRALPVPARRALVELSGPFDEVRERLCALEWREPEPPIVFASIEVRDHQPGLEAELHRALAARARAAAAPRLARVTQQRVTPAGDCLALGGLPSLRQLSPEQVFRRLCAERGEPLDEPLLVTFRSLLAPSPDETEGER